MYYFFFFNDTATTEIYTLSLHDALPIYEDGVAVVELRELHVPRAIAGHLERAGGGDLGRCRRDLRILPDRKSTRLNSSHANISYAVFCLKKKKKKNNVQLHCKTRQRTPR